MITPWLAKIPFPVADEVRKYRDDIVKLGLEPERKQSNKLFPFENPELKQYLFEEWNKTIHEHFVVNEFSGKFRLGVLVKNNKYVSVSNPDNGRIFHNHLKCTINTAIYITPPKEPTFEIIDPDVNGLAEGCTTKIITVEENYLYCTPNWLYHRIRDQQDERYRITINMEYHSEGNAYLRTEKKFDRPHGGLTGHNHIWSSSWNVGM